MPYLCLFDNAVIVDLGLAIVALRYLSLLLGVGIVLSYFKLWILLTVYVLLLSIAISRFFHIDSETIKQEEQYQKQSRDAYIRLLRVPLRGLASVVLLYASWQFFGWHPLNAVWRYSTSTEVSKVEEARNAEETLRTEEARKTDNARKVEEKDLQRKNPSGESDSQRPLQSNTQNTGVNKENGDGFIFGV